MIPKITSLGLGTLFLLSLSFLSSPRADTFQVFDLKTRLAIPSPIKEARTFHFETLEISQLRLRLDGVSISYHGDKGITVVIKKLTGDIPKLLEFLRKEGLLASELPIDGPITLENLNIEWHSQRWRVSVQKALVSGIEVEDILGIFSAQGNGTPKTLTLSFSRAQVEAGRFQGFTEKFLEKDLAYYLKKGLPWLILESPELAGIIELSHGRLDLRSSEKNWKLGSISMKLKTGLLKVLSKGKEPCRLSLEGEFSGNATGLEFRFSKLHLGLNSLVLGFEPWRIDLQKAQVRMKGLEGSYRDGDLSLSTSISIDQGGGVRVKRKDWVKEIFLDTPFSSEIVIESLKGKRMHLSNASLSVKDEGGGSVRLSLDKFSLPFSFSDTAFNLRVKGFTLRDMVLEDFSAQKDSGKDLHLKATGSKGGLRFEVSEGFLSYSPELFRLRISALKVKGGKEKSSSRGKDEPFDFTFLETMGRISKAWRLECDTVEYEDYVPLENLSAELLLKKTPYPFRFQADVCYTHLGGSGEIEPEGKLWFSGELQTVSAPVDNFLACFLTEAPVYVRGDLTFRFSFESEGESGASLKKAFSFQGRGDLRGGQILRISNLHENLRWFLDILSLVKLNPSKLKDTVPFEELVFVLGGGLNRIDIKNLTLSSPLLKMRMVLGGRLTFQPKFKRELQGEITVMGVSKSFVIHDKEKKK